jgi:acyl phosphate:glycerol-3-phosphate acyltransferase
LAAGVEYSAIADFEEGISHSMPKLVWIAVTSYLLGSIPFGYLLVRIFRGEDVRHSGSGNIGATNVARKSPLLGILTLLLDAAKGSSAVLLGVVLTSAELSSFSITRTPWREIMASWAPEHTVPAAFAGFCAILGHMLPPWLRFRGGKGVATGLGAFGLIAPKAILCSGGFFVATVLAFRYISLGSIVAVMLFPTLAWTLDEFGKKWLALAFMSLSSLAIVLKHHQNIHRLLAGTENRIGAKPSVHQGNR